MESFEPKKLALLRIWQILNNESDYDHPLTQEQIAQHLEYEYGIVMERNHNHPSNGWFAQGLKAHNADPRLKARAFSLFKP